MNYETIATDIEDDKTKMVAESDAEDYWDEDKYYITNIKKKYIPDFFV